MKKIFPFVIVLALSITLAALPVQAAEDVQASGGWDELTGYFIDGHHGTAKTYEAIKNSIDAISTYGVPAATPDSHTGKRLARVWNGGGDTEYASLGETLWYYKYHYTRARMETNSGTVLSDSLRVWDINATKAQSPYYKPTGFFENDYHARSYWGS